MNKALLFTGVVVLTLASASAGYYLHQYRSDPARTEGGTANSPTSVRPDLTGTIRPDFSLPDIKGNIRHISEWDGQVVALNFWATWCPPCLKEIPEFIALQDKYSRRGVQFVGIALHSPDEVVEFVAKQGMNYPVLVGELEVIELAHAYGNEMGTLPYTVIISRDKRIEYIKNGQLHGSQAEEVITNLL